MKLLSQSELEKYKMILQPTNKMQKFPKVLRFYRKKDNNYYGFGGIKHMGGLIQEYKLNGKLTEEQSYMAKMMRENDN